MWSKGSGSCGILFHALQRVFEIAETGAIVLRRVLTPDLYADIGGVVVQICHQNLAYELVEMRVLLDDIADLRSEGTDKTVGQENAEKRTDKRATDHLAQDFRRLVDRGHGLDHPQNRRHDAERRKPVRHGLQGMARMQGVMLAGLHALFQHPST